jgi:hypothetical protein
LAHVVANRSGIGKGTDLAERLYLAANDRLVSRQKIYRSRHQSIAYAPSGPIKADVSFFGMPAQSEASPERPRLPDVADDIVIEQEHMLAATQQDDQVPVSRRAGSEQKVYEGLVDDLIQCRTNCLPLGSSDVCDVAAGRATD